MAIVGLVALYLAGVSFFFTGVSGISENLRLMSGQRFRLLLARATHHPVFAGLLGAPMGAVTQSASVVALILTGMVATGMLALRRALLVLSCANLGTALLVFIATLDLRLPVLFLIGISGLILAFKLMPSWKPGWAALLSVGLVFFGLDTMKEAFKPLSSSAGALNVGKFFEAFPDAAFFAGIFMRTFVHSSSSVAAISITLNKGSLLGDFPAMMGLAGLGMGTAVATYVLSSNVKGVSRQITIHQATANFGASIFVALLLSIERFTHLPMLLALLNRLSSSMSGRMAIMYFIFNIVIVVVAVATLPWAPAWLAKLSPPTPEENLSRPMYLESEALLSPETALDLVALEQLRLVRALEQYLKSARGSIEIKLDSLHAAAGELGNEISQFLESLVKLPMAADLITRSISFQRKQETLRALEENVYLFAETMALRVAGKELLPDTSALAGRLIEALDTIVLTAADALSSKDEGDIDMLIRLTDDRGGMMERLRKRMQVDEMLDVDNLSALHYATTLFERNVWLLRQLALWLREDIKTADALLDSQISKALTT
jgi:phosphate:Na+ symporter